MVGPLSAGSFHVVIIALVRAGGKDSLLQIDTPYSKSCVAWVGQERDDYGVRI
jgi:hypothetical protein